MIEITLPFPVSVNALYAGRGRRFKSKRYQSWITQSRNALRYQKFSPLMDKYPLQIIYTFGRPDKRIRDCANYIKCVDDFLVSQGIILDDSWIHRGVFQWGNVEGVKIEISLL